MFAGRLTLNVPFDHQGIRSSVIIPSGSARAMRRLAKDNEMRKQAADRRARLARARYIKQAQTAAQPQPTTSDDTAPCIREMLDAWDAFQADSKAAYMTRLIQRRTTTE
ncbi:hypothetical protein QZM81_19420 [Burkholderia cepacia]|uniref:hypothetical protein n=1 Tax=Burkholderia cepacia TaxID=292 RepID=UPI00264B7876|nr:hypothetical protein [Burkholderia cepacia]MDN7857977.1 hypothetical protein [Burkholderia cepacia]